MDAYYESYFKPEPVDKFIQDICLKGIQQAFVEMSKGPSVTTADKSCISSLFGRLQRNKRRQGGPISRRIVVCHNLIRYQHTAISCLSKAIRPASKVTKRNQFRIA